MPLLAVLFLIPLFLSACSSTPPVRRTDVTVRGYDDLVVSNSLNLHEEPTDSPQGGKQIVYSLLMQNFSKTKPCPLYLSTADFRIGSQSFKALCVEREKSANDIDLDPGQYARIDCTIRVVADEENRLKEHNETGVLRISYGEISKRKQMTFNYFLQAKDFQ